MVQQRAKVEKGPLWGTVKGSGDTGPGEKGGCTGGLGRVRLPTPERDLRWSRVVVFMKDGGCGSLRTLLPLQEVVYRSPATHLSRRTCDPEKTRPVQERGFRSPLKRKVNSSRVPNYGLNYREKAG